MARIDVSNYEHSPVHKAIILRDFKSLEKIISELPQFCDPTKIQTESDSLAEEAKADAIAAVLDRRDVPNQDTPLHLAIKFCDHITVKMLLLAGADYSLQNEKGWNAIQEALCGGVYHIARLMLEHYEPLAWAKWCRRLPRLIGTMRRMRDFYMEIKFHFESSAVPFISRLAPSDTYKIWKRGANLRVDLTFDGFEGFRVKRSSKSFRFLGDGAEAGKVRPGLLCVVSHKDKEITYGLEGSADLTTEADVERGIRTTAEVMRTRMSFNQAVLVPQMTWRKREKTEMVGHWKAKVYDMHNVVLSYKTRRSQLARTMDDDFESELLDVLTVEEKKQLDNALNMDLDYDESTNQSETKREKKGWLSGWRRKLSKRNEKKIDPPMSPPSECPRSPQPEPTEIDSDDVGSPHPVRIEDDPGSPHPPPIENDVKRDKYQNERDTIQEKEGKKSLRPTIWLSSDFPLQIEEFMPLLGILANRVTAIRRLREYLTTKLPEGTFPVKVSVPVLPTIRVIVTFSKFEDLSKTTSSPAAGVTPSWFNRTKSASTRPENIEDPFAFPSGYTWITQTEKKLRKLETEVGKY